MKFKSKTGWFALVSVCLPIILTVLHILAALQGEWRIPQTIVLISLVIGATYTISTFINTYYVLRENELYIRYGLLFKLRIPYKNIIS